jgi:molecular chaperone GrpE (heat shock protein)
MNHNWMNHDPRDETPVSGGGLFPVPLEPERRMPAAAESGTAHQDKSADSNLDVDTELLGAVHIVKAFTALRHELKLQVRNGREMQQSLSEGLRLIEQRLAAQSRPSEPMAVTETSRELAEALAEVEESLHRAVEALAEQATAAAPAESLSSQFDEAVAAASWTARTFARPLLRDLRELIEQLECDAEASLAVVDTSRQGLELLLARVHRLMAQCRIERVDVLEEAFDAELMHAVDVVEAADVPTTHVAEQLRPAYRWQGKILRCAHVRIAR